MTEASEIVRAGDAGETMFVITNGKCEVLAGEESKGGEGKRAQILKAGDSFGECVALGITTEYDDTVVAMERVELLLASKDGEHDCPHRQLSPPAHFRVPFQRSQALPSTPKYSRALSSTSNASKPFGCLQRYSSLS